MGNIFWLHALPVQVDAWSKQPLQFIILFILQWLSSPANEKVPLPPSTVHVDETRCLQELEVLEEGECAHVVPDHEVPAGPQALQHHPEEGPVSLLDAARRLRLILLYGIVLPRAYQHPRGEGRAHNVIPARPLVQRHW